MSWLDKLSGKLSGKKQQAETLLPPKEQMPNTPPNSGAGGTVVRAGGRTVPQSSAGLKPGDEVAGNLRIKRLLGRGGMGEVWLARQKQWDVEVAVKIPKAEILADAQNRHRIAREAEAWTDLGLHPHIAYCYYAQPVDELLLLVIEYIDGGSLREWIAEGRCADLKTGLDLAIQFCHGLERAHARGLVHRDIKPENVLLTKDGTLKITDFGIVRKALAGVDSAESVFAMSKTVAGGMTMVAVGTEDYMAPEQWGQQEAIDLRADIFAFGVCLYEMCCGRRPYTTTAGPRQEAPEPASLRGDGRFPQRLARLIQRCVDWDRENRPAGAEEVRAELCAVYEEAFGEPSLRAELPALTALADDWNNRALSYLALGRVEDAANAWQTALKADPRHAESTYNYGLHRWRGVEITDQELLAALRGMIESDSSSWLPRYMLAQIHMEQGDSDGAAKELGRIEGEGASRSEVGAMRQAMNMRALGAPSQLVRTFEGHTDFVWSVCLSADGRHALSASTDKTLKLWDPASGRCLRTFEGHTDSVFSVCLSGDGRYALSGSEDKTLKLWEMKSGRHVRTFEGHTAGVRSVCLSGDGRYAISGSNDNTLKLWEVASGRCLRTFEGHTKFVRSVCLCADGRYALSGEGGTQWTMVAKGKVLGQDSTLKLWEVASGRCLRTFEGHTGSVISVCLSSDGRYALSGSEDSTLKLWEVASGRCFRTFRGHNHYVNSVCLSGDGRYALSGAGEIHHDNTLKLWEVDTGRCLRTWKGHTSWVESVCLSADGRYILSGSRDKTLKLWGAGKVGFRAGFRLSQVVKSVEAMSVAARYEAALSDARSASAAGNTLGTYRHLCVARQQPGHRRAVPSVREWGKLYVKMRRGGLVDCWLCWTAMHVGSVVSVCLSADGRFALSGNYNHALKLWEVESGRCLQTFEGHTGGVDSVCLSADGRYALSGSSDRIVKLWEVANGHCLRNFQGNSVCMSGDGRYALSGSSNMPLMLWEVASGRCLRTLKGRKYHAHSVCLSGDGRYALLGGEDKTFWLLDLTTGRCMRAFEGHTGNVCSVCLSADGRRALSGSGDKTLKLWEVESGCCLRTFEGHTGNVRSVCLSADGQLALSGSEDKTVKFWEVQSGRCLRTLEHKGSVYSVSLSADGQHAIFGYLGGGEALWFLDWDLEENEPADWDEGVRSYLDVFLRAHQPYAAALPNDRQPTDEEVTRALTRHGRPNWSEDDFNGLLYTLGCAGYGWLRPEGMRRELEQMAKAW